ncbi:unnamed protein product [Urochloa decumbens]|uniref:DUF4220 domain-containing protein n=1 Tax=Urochloa decumbens TaxID=240449 RepID=A0ABC9AK96_9POAL
MLDGDEDSGDCNGTEWISFRKDMGGKLWQANALLLASDVMAGLILVIGVPVATATILSSVLSSSVPPLCSCQSIISYVLSTTSEFDSCISSRDRKEGPYALHNSVPALIAQCDQGKHLLLVVTWALLVQNVMTNISIVVAVDDREGRSVGPPIELAAQVAWTIYLGINHINIAIDYGSNVSISDADISVVYLLLVLPCALILAKLALKYYAAKEAQQSFSFGRNPRLVFGYVQQLPLNVGEHSPLPLLVMGEETRHVDKKPHGYVFEDDGDEPGTRLHKGIGLVTMDRVWQLDSNSMLDLPEPTTHRVKDLCLSYALFKLLRCRFARYELSENTSIFFWKPVLRRGPTVSAFGVCGDRCKLMKHWDVEMGQCSVLTPLHRPPRTTLLAPVGRLLCLPDDKREVNAAVKASIINALRNSRNGQLSNGTASLCRWSQGGGERLLWACNSKSASDVILIWQIATSILELRYPDQHQAISTSDSNRTVANHLSRYCAYLVRSHPELLPDDDAWSKSLYEDVNKDARQALAAGSSSTPPDYQRLVHLLSAKSKHPVLKDGVKLAEQLVETISGEEIMAWQLLANFWSEMILYVTPSDNLKGHKESVARGGELITLLWAMLSHAGFVSRTSDAARKAACW